MTALHATLPASAPALASVDASAWGCVDFLSDVHLHSADPATAQAWLAYLRHTPADALFILGDLFEAWVGDDVLHNPLGVFEQSCAQALAECTASKPVFFVCGNRDFLIGPGFFQFTGVQALSEPCTVLSSAGPLLLSHGDALCTDDHDYLAFRAQVRSPEWQSAFLAQPLPERMAQARAMRAQSQAKQEAMVSLPDVNPLACEAALTQHQTQGTTALAAAPTIEQRLPAFGQVHHFTFKVTGNVGSYQRGADFVGFESAFLFVNRAHPDAFFIGEGRPVHSPRQMIQGVFRFAAGIDDATEGTSGPRGQGHALHGLGGRHREQGHQSIFFNTAHTLAKMRGWASALG